MDWQGGQCDFFNVELSLLGLASLSESESETIVCGDVGLACASHGRPGGGLVLVLWWVKCG